MDEQAGRADAARALSEIGRRREQVIRRRVIPGWFWWAQAALVVGLEASVESGRGVVLGIGLAVFAAGSLAITRPVSRAARAARPRRGLAGPGFTRMALAGLAAFLVILFGVLLATALSLNAAGVPHPGTIATAVTAVVFAAGGQLLVRAEMAVLVRRSRSRG